MLGFAELIIDASLWGFVLFAGSMDAAMICVALMLRKAAVWAGEAGGALAEGELLPSESEAV